MQFKHPEILWALLLLLIPIFIHLFQLRKFKKTPFTNVAMLQKVIAESRKSNTLKKWLLLCTRLLLLACLVLAFAQPFFAKETALQEKETVIYLDDSFSMQAKIDGLSLLDKAVQDLIKSVPQESDISLFTNRKTFKNTTFDAIQNQLLTLNTGPGQLTYEAVLLKANSIFSDNTNSQKNLIVVSDFQDSFLKERSVDSTKNLRVHLAQMTPENTANIAIDSVYFGEEKDNQIELVAVLSGLAEDQNLPISLFDDNTLIAKTAVEPKGKSTSEVLFSLPIGNEIKARLAIEDNSLRYDNQFYFSIAKKDPIKVLAINEQNDDYLTRLFTPDEFDFLSFSLQELNYSKISTQNLVVLNGLKSVPTSLQNILISYYNNGGHLVVVPEVDLDFSSYNTFLSALAGIKFMGKTASQQSITQISFDHPLYKNVFEKEVTNFDYPEVQTSFQIDYNAPRALSYANGSGFLVGDDQLHVFTASLAVENSNFTGSPLIVPTFYNLAHNSLKNAQLYQNLGAKTSLDIAVDLDRDHIIKLRKEGKEYVPMQQRFNDRVQLSFSEYLDEDGIYAALNGSDTVQHIAFNHARTEGILNYRNTQDLNAEKVGGSISDLFQQLQEDNTITDYWKWFVIFALLFALTEVLLQKFLS